MIGSLHFCVVKVIYRQANVAIRKVELGCTASANAERCTQILFALLMVMTCCVINRDAISLLIKTRLAVAAGKTCKRHQINRQYE